MAREIILYPKKASKNELKEFVEKRGYKKTEHLWNWPKGTLNFFWFDDDDYKSIAGVELDIYPVDNTENKYTNNKWAIHVRNLVSGSIFDVREFNDVVRAIRKKFGGTLIGDYGKNRYAPLWDDDSVPMQRGIEREYKYHNGVLKKITLALPNEIFSIPKTDDAKIKSFIDFTKQQDPSTVIYNGLIPLLISTVESILRSYFIIILKYDTLARQNLENLSKIKLDFSSIEKIEAGIYSKEWIVADQYNFQNLESIKKAFDLFNIDIYKTLHNKILRKSNPRTDLFQLISKLINDRHEIIHNLIFDLSLSKSVFLNKLNIVQNVIDAVTDEIEKKYGFKIDRKNIM